MEQYFTAADFVEKLADAERLAVEFGNWYNLPVGTVRAYLFGEDAGMSRRLYAANGVAIRAALRSLGWKGATYVHINGHSALGFTKQIPLELIIQRYNAQREATAESPQ